jgi:hypothetical protein
MLNKKALAGTPSTPPAFVEDVFSTYLYAGNGTNNQTITNGVDLAGKGGLVWIKSRTDTNDHVLSDTARGVDGKYLISSSAAAEGNDTTIGIQSFNADGFTTNKFYVNESATNYCSWTFREQAKFFDVVTYTGNGAARTIAHNLGSVPGMMFVKATSGSADWNVYHRSLGNTFRLLLNSTAQAFDIGSVCWNATTPTSSVFSLGTNTGVNESGVTYVAYLFAHNAGGFGEAETDNVISCGSFTTNGSGIATVDLGYEPQYVLIKQTDGADSWYVNDIMRGMSVGTSDRNLSPNTSGAEVASGYETDPTATGFIANPGIASKNYIYMAIRRPMKVPTTGTSVFAPITYAGTNTAGQVISGAGFSPDLSIPFSRAGAGGAKSQFIDRLRGGTAYLPPSSTAAEGNTGGYYIRSFDMDGVTYGTAYLDYTNASYNYVNWMFKRASGFFDVVCYMGDGNSGYLVKHNLTVVPELAIIKRRDSTGNWVVSSSARQTSTNSNVTLNLNTNDAEAIGNGASLYASQSTTTQVFINGTSGDVNASGWQYVMYLFATVAGVSKVGSYTGNGSSQTINCGFTAGARFVLIKRTDSTGDWYVYDTARGIVSGNDPQLKLNSTAAEATGYDAIDPDNSGFIVNNDATNFPINVNNATYIFYAVA